MGLKRSDILHLYMMDSTWVDCINWPSYTAEIPFGSGLYQQKTYWVAPWGERVTIIWKAGKKK